MFYLRTTKTASDATAVQVVRYDYRKRIVVKHIGSAHTPEDLLSLKQTARNWIEQETHQQRLFPEETKPFLTPIEKCGFFFFLYLIFFFIFFLLFSFFL